MEAEPQLSPHPPGSVFPPPLVRDTGGTGQAAATGPDRRDRSQGPRGFGRGGSWRLATEPTSQGARALRTESDLNRHRAIAVACDQLVEGQPVQVFRDMHRSPGV